MFFIFPLVNPLHGESNYRKYVYFSGVPQANPSYEGEFQSMDHASIDINTQYSTFKWRFPKSRHPQIIKIEPF